MNKILKPSLLNVLRGWAIWTSRGLLNCLSTKLLQVFKCTRVVALKLAPATAELCLPRAYLAWVATEILKRVSLHLQCTLIFKEPYSTGNEKNPNLVF